MPVARGSASLPAVFPTDSFPTFGPLCRAAVVLHEPIHYVDCLTNPRNDFYEHGQQYAYLTPQQAIHNPSSYVAFAEHVFYSQPRPAGTLDVISSPKRKVRGFSWTTEPCSGLVSTVQRRGVSRQR